ncbi:MAG: HDIG domain-containing protein [Chloroflexota bacterium]|nr:HDIG domain-containing protein [Chloroflexota bacterium]
MGIPSRAAARELLLDFGLPDGIVTHSEGVARVAAEAARLVAAAGIPVDTALVEVAALLHDVDKMQVRARGGRHGDVGAEELTRRGFAELAPAVRSHPLPCLLDEERFPRGWPSVLVSVADRHVAQVFLTIDERLGEMAERHREYRREIASAARPAHRLEEDVAATIGLATEEFVTRLRAAWEAGV